MKICLTASRLFTPCELVEHPVLIVEDGTIERVGSRNDTEIPRSCSHSDFPNLIIAPGYIDIHVHGGAGHDVMQDDPSGVTAFEKALGRHGVTSYLPTTVTAPLPRILGAVDRLGNSISAEHEEQRHMGARPLGIHLEGPFISAAKCGVHPIEHLLAPSPALFQQLWEASGGSLKMMTIAPELDGAPEMIDEARKHGVLTSLGHSNANFAEAGRGIAAGAVSATHTFNAMRPLDHREPGILGAVLTSDELMADIIADGIHVAPAVVKLFLQTKGPNRAILITDGISATGMPDGTYRLGSFEVQVRDGRAELDGKLAGSVLTMDRAVRNITEFGNWSLQQSIVLATRNPAQLIGADKKGVIAPGNDADLVVLSSQGKVVHTMVAGEFLKE
jgi:N-acetylglucosamine-6-phosphate deacetylase